MTSNYYPHTYYPHTTFTFCSAANKLKLNVKETFKRLTEEFAKGNVTYPRTDGVGHSEIKVINERLVSNEIKNVLKTPPVLKKEESYVIGDVYSLAGELFLSTPASLVNDVEEAKKIKIPDRVDLYIGLKREKFFNNESLFIDVKKTSMEVLKKIFKEDLSKSKNKIPAYNKKREKMVIKIA